MVRAAAGVVTAVPGPLGAESSCEHCLKSPLAGRTAPRGAPCVTVTAVSQGHPHLHAGTRRRCPGRVTHTPARHQWVSKREFRPSAATQGLLPLRSESLMDPRVWGRMVERDLGGGEPRWGPPATLGTMPFQHPLCPPAPRAAALWGSSLWGTSGPGQRPLRARGAPCWPQEPHCRRPSR